MNGLSVKRSFSAASGNDSSEHRPLKLARTEPGSADTAERKWGSWLIDSAVNSFKALFSTSDLSRYHARSLPALGAALSPALGAALSPALGAALTLTDIDQQPMRSTARTGPSSGPLASHPRGALGWLDNSTPVRQVFEVLDDGEDSEPESISVRQKRDRGKLQALEHLNDHAPRSASTTGPTGIHPNLAQPLFASKFSPGLHSLALVNGRSTDVESSSPGAGPSSTPSTPSTASNRPDVNFKKPVRNYAWKQDESTLQTTHDAFFRTPRQRLPRSPRSSTNLRAGRNDSGQEKMLQRHYDEAVNSGDHKAALSISRVRDVLQQNRSRGRRDATRPFAAHVVGLPPDLRKEGDLSSSLRNLNLDNRRPLDETLQGPREPRPIPKPIRGNRRPAPIPLEVHKTHVYDQLRREDEEAERQVQKRLQPRIPEDVTAQQDDIIKDRLRDRSFEATLGTATLSSSSLQRLKPDVWLNDEVMNFYAELINVRAKSEGRLLHCMNTFFYEKLSSVGYAGAKLARWTKRLKLDIFALDKLLIPINHGNSHWVCAVVNFKQKRIEYYDSLSDSGRRHQVFKNLRGYLQSEHQEKKGSPFDLSDWVDQYDPDTPKQHNGTDCGVFACQTLESTARGRDLVKQKFEFNGRNMAFFRRLMVVEIASGALGERPWGT